MTTVEVLEKARALVARPGGWQQHGYGDETCCCAEGALGLAEVGQVDCANSSGRAWRLLEYAIGQSDLHRWNDAPRRTQAEVVAAFDKAIELARSAP